MQKLIVTLPLVVLLFFSGAAVGLAGVEVAEKCRQCGMSRSRFSYSRMLVSYRNKTQSAVCSLHCAAADIAKAPEKQGVALQVADYHSKKLIAAETAVWVMGGSKAGVMTAHPKWAFSTPEAAQRFLTKNGGSIVSFSQAMKDAGGEVEQEAAAMREYSQMQRHQGH
jgi:copper chaperone NosL